MFLPRILLLSVFLFFFTLNAMAANIGIQVIDTIAGYPSIMQTQKIAENTNITFRVEKPDGSVITLPARSNADGYAETELSGYHTKKAGLYKVSAAEEYKEFGSPVNFQVFSDVFSSVKSKITTDKPSLAAQTDTLTVRVQLKDKYENPISGHSVKLLSSRNEDSITAIQNISNEDGVAVFDVQSNREGVSIFTAIDQTTNQEVYERSKIVFYATEESSPIGGNDFYASLLDEGNSEEFLILDHFDITFPDTVEVNDDQNHLKISARDANGNVVRSYTGTIKIAVTGDDNAIIPNEGEYTFTEKDQGEKEFALAMIFTQIGEIKIEVFDYEDGQINQNLRGEKTINVQEAKNNNENTGPNTSSELVIKSPVNGSELASTTITVSGLAVPNTNLKLMLDDIKVSEIETDMEGFFATTLTDLDDGPKEIYVMEAEGLRRSSEPVRFTIDATPPQIDTVDIFPQEAVYPQTSYTLTLYSEPDLDYAKIRVAGIEEPLTESSVTPGKYEGTFFAPQNIGSYNIDIIIADRMGNTGDYRNQKKLEVIEKIIVKPGVPSGLKINPADQALEVTWNAVQGEKQIDHYKVYAGTVVTDLAVGTQSRTNKALLSGLSNGSEYFVAVSAVDVEGIESDKSEIIPATPEKNIPAKATNLKGTGGDSTINITWDYSGTEINHFNVYIGSDINSLQKSTESSVKSAVIGNLENGKEYTVAVSAVGINDIEGELSEIITVSPASLHATLPKRAPLRAIAGDSKVTLSWDSFEGAEKYKIAFGVSSKSYEVEVTTEDDVTSYVIKDLLNGMPYYFTVTALDQVGFALSENYPEVSATPNGFGFQVIPSKKQIPRIQVEDVKEMSQTGPETWALLAVAILAAFGIFASKRRKTATDSGPIQEEVTMSFDTNKLQF